MKLLEAMQFPLKTPKRHQFHINQDYSFTWTTRQYRTSILKGAFPIHVSLNSHNKPVDGYDQHPDPVHKKVH